MTEAPLHKVVLLSDKTNIPQPGKKKKTSLLPALNFLPGKEFDGIFALADGGVRQVIRCNGINPIFNGERARALEKELAKVLLSSDCSLQMVLISRPFNLDNYRRELLPLTNHENEYLKWYADYSDKWLRKVTETAPVPDKDCFIVITQPGRFSQAASKKISKLARDQIVLLKKNLSKFSKLLAFFNLAPELLNRNQTRAMLASALFPPADSDAFLQSDIPESLSDSTICEPEFRESDSLLQTGDLQMRSFYLSRLPAVNWMGWLVDSIVATHPLTVSVHIQQCAQAEVRSRIRRHIAAGQVDKALQPLLTGKDKALDVSIYVSTYANTKAEVYHQHQQAKEFLRKKGATLRDARGNQIDAFRSVIPLGFDALAVKHRVSTIVAAGCWPLFTALENKAVGFPIGFALQSREPAFLETRFAINTFVAGGSSETTESLCTLIALKHLCSGSPVLYLGNSESAQFLSSMLGPEMSGEMQDQQDSLDAALFLHLIQPAKLLTEFRSSSNAMAAFFKYAKAHKPFICIEETAPFLKTKDSKQLLQTIIDFARAHKLHLAIGSNATAAANKQNYQFAKECPVKIIIPQLNKESFLTEMEINEAQTKVCQSYSCAILQTQTGASCIRLINSPMDFFIAPDSLWGCGQTRKDGVARRAALIQSCKDKNPKLSKTDSIRQGIYYAGLTSKE